MLREREYSVRRLVNRGENVKTKVARTENHARLAGTGMMRYAFRNIAEAAMTGTAFGKKPKEEAGPAAPAREVIRMAAGKDCSSKALIRMAGEKDCLSIKSVALSAYAVYLERMKTKPFPMLDDYSEHIKHERAYVLEYENAVCGYVVLIKKDSDTLLLDNIAVHPGSQGRGYGRCLARFAEEWGKKYGFNRICLYTNEVMTENLFWYQRLGYSVTHNAVENGYRRIYMAKALS